MIALLAPLPLPSPPPLASLAQAPAPVIPSYVACPANLTARYGGVLGWSSIPVQANFAAAVIDPGKGLMTCQYGFGVAPRPFFGIQKPCPAGYRCIPDRAGFRIVR
jgi:hypothetical protein